MIRSLKSFQNLFCGRVSCILQWSMFVWISSIVWGEFVLCCFFFSLSLLVLLSLSSSALMIHMVIIGAIMVLGLQLCGVSFSECFMLSLCFVQRMFVDGCEGVLFIAECTIIALSSVCVSVCVRYM